MNAKPTSLTGMSESTAYRLGCQDARDGDIVWLFDNPNDSIDKARRAHRTGYQAELVRIANRRMTAAQRDLLIAHDRAADEFNRAAARNAAGRPFQYPDAQEDDAFIRADLALFGLNPWRTLGIKISQYDGPAAQAKGRLYA